MFKFGQIYIASNGLNNFQAQRKVMFSQACVSHSVYDVTSCLAAWCLMVFEMGGGVKGGVGHTPPRARDRHPPRYFH